MDIKNFRRKLGARNEYLASIIKKKRDKKIESEIERNTPLLFDYVNQESKAWRDELGDITRIQKKGQRITDDKEEGTVKFSDDTVMGDDYLYTNVQLNHDRDPDSPIFPHLHFFQTSDEIPNFVLGYRWQVNLDQKVDVWQKLRVLGVGRDYTEVDREMHQIAFFGPIEPPDNNNISDIVQFRIYRDTDDSSGLFGASDPVTGDVHVLSFDLHLYQDAWGSWDQYKKYKDGPDATEVPGPPRSSVVELDWVDSGDKSVVTAIDYNLGSSTISIKDTETYADVLDHIKSADNSSISVRFLDSNGDTIAATANPTTSDVVEVTAEDGLTKENYTVTAVT